MKTNHINFVAYLIYYLNAIVVFSAVFYLLYLPYKKRVQQSKKKHELLHHIHISIEERKKELTSILASEGKTILSQNGNVILYKEKKSTFSTLTFFLLLACGGIPGLLYLIFQPQKEEVSSYTIDEA